MQMPVWAWLLLAAGVLGIAVAVYLRSGRWKVEDPARIKELLATVQGLQWTSANPGDTLQALANALTKMVDAEIEYYYLTRGRRRRASKVFRAFAFLFGTVGLLCPLLEAAAPIGAAGYAKTGYIFLALAAACIAGNELFGGTRGHIRSVATQYKLEGLLTAFILEWSRWQHDAALRGDPVDVEPAFAALKLLSQGVHQAIQSETQEWGLTIVAAEAAYGQGLKQGKPQAQ
jgi:hypothetical protein